ncbi:MAG: PLP-dependent aminotransferase family protein, partial [Micropruina sp.]
PLGLPLLREQLAQHYSDEGLPTRPDQVLITNGAQQGISLAIGSLLRSGDACVLETPTFFGAIDALRAARARLVGVDVDADGPSPAAFERAVAQHGPRLAFLTPTFQNPTGSVMPALARERIGAVIARSQVPLIEDDTLIDLSFGRTTPPRIAALAPDAPIISIGSLSKLYWAGLRVGWMRVPDALLPRLVQAKTLADFGSALPSQVIAGRLLADLPRLRELRRATALPGRDLLVSLLRERVPTWEFEVPAGGQFLWVRLPTRNATGFTQVAGRHGVRVFPGAAMGVTALPDCWLRLPFTMPIELLADAVARLADAWADFVRRDGHDRLG